MKICRILFLLLVAPFMLMAQPELSLVQYVTGLNRPVDIVHAGDDRLFIVEQSGRIKIIDGDGTLLPDPYLQLNVNNNGNEQGLLGMAFHPDYATNGYFFINYTTGSGSGSSKVVRYSVDPGNPNSALPNSDYEILEVGQPYSNHNGGGLKFGPDGFLYIGFGDGGAANDPQANSQNTQTMLGKIIRIDINTDGSVPYTIPSGPGASGNPFINDSDVLDEIWAIGLRNPWRYSFDRLTGDLWIGDVGQNAWEEIDFEPAGSLGGLNYGWDCKEGFVNFEPNNCAANTEFVSPVTTYSEGSGNSVTGGYVYRGCEFPDLYGHYIYGDYVHGIIWSISPDGNGGWANVELYDNNDVDISTFGEDKEGNLYVARLAAGVIYKISTAFELAPLVYDEPNDIITAPAGYEAYQWYQNGLILNGETNETLEGVFAMGNANYYCQVTYNQGNCTFYTNEVSVIGVGLEEIPGLTYFNVNPNPFTDKVFLEVAMEKDLYLSIDLINVKGEVLFTLPQNTEPSFRQEINLGYLVNGVYFVRVQTKKGKMITQKVVKQ